jgi:hypothetical protein
MKLTILTIVAISLSSFASLKAQSKHDIDRIERKYDSCSKAYRAAVGPGDEEWAPACWDAYTKSLDSLEVAAFKHMIAIAPNVKHDLLNVVELQWYKKRDAYYKKEDASDDGELTEIKKAEYVEKHIRILIKQRQSLEKQKKS